MNRTKWRGRTLEFSRFHRPLQKWVRSIGLSALVGVLAGLAAIALMSSLHFFSDRWIGRFVALGSAELFRLRIEVLLLPALGGLLSGIVVQGILRSDKLNGTDAYAHAFHEQNGKLGIVDPGVRAAMSVGVIASGGSAGPEGPIAGLSAAIGSTVGEFFCLSPKDRRILLVAGCAGGVGAVFNCPLGGALFATSVLYKQAEFEGQALVSAFIASIVSYSTYMMFLGYDTFLAGNATQLRFGHPIELLPYAVLGVLSGLAAICYGVCMSLSERAFAHFTKVPAWLKPALGGLLAGAVACVVPQVVDGEYRFVKNALDGSLFGGPVTQWWDWVQLFALVVVAKCVATALTLRSGGAGGMLGPSVFIGGTVGAFAGALFQALAPAMFPETLRAAMIPAGIAGVIGASMRTPIAALVMAVEMTGSHGLVVPLMLVTTVAYLVGGRWGLVKTQLRNAAESPVHAGDALVQLLEKYSVQDVMEARWPYVVAPSAKLAELLAKIERGSWPYFVVLEGSQVRGMISITDLLLLKEEAPSSEWIIAADLMTTHLFVVRPHDSLYQALNLMQEHKLVALPVVQRIDGASAFVGMIARRAIYDLVRGDLDRLRKLMLQEHTGLAAIEEDAQRLHVLEDVPNAEERRVERIAVPSEVVGRSLRSANFRNTYHCEVIAIQTAQGEFVCPADPDRLLAKSDALLVMLRASQSERADAPL